jgi:hypothetical protein
MKATNPDDVLDVVEVNLLTIKKRSVGAIRHYCLEDVWHACTGSGPHTVV